MKHTLICGAAMALALAGATQGCKQHEPWAAPESDTQQAQPPLPTVTVTVGQVNLQVEVADDENTRRMGYKFREKPADAGMLFVFPEEKMTAFYMMNVTFDLDLAYIADDGTLFQIERMKAFRMATVPSLRPAKYALEVPAGWFAEHHVTEGARVAIPDSVVAKDVPEEKPGTTPKE